MKGVIPAKKPVTTTKTEPKEEKAVEKQKSNPSGFKPIRRGKNGIVTSETTTVSKDGKKETTRIAKVVDPSNMKMTRVPSKEEADIVADLIIERLMEKFVTKEEVEEVVTKALQKMVVKNNVSKK